MRRTTAAIKAFKIQNWNNRHYGYGIPKHFSYMLGSTAVNLPIRSPKYRSKKEFLSDHDPKVFAELHSQHLNWFYKFTDEIISSTTTDDVYPFYNSELDVAMPGISALRVYDSDQDVFVQIQVSRIANYDSLFQLDYYEKEGKYMTLKSIILCDISDLSQTLFDNVYGCPSTDSARKICTVFRCMLVYLRTWDYSVEQKYCEVTPLFNSNSTRYWN